MKASYLGIHMLEVQHSSNCFNTQYHLESSCFHLSMGMNVLSLKFRYLLYLWHILCLL